MPLTPDLTEFTTASPIIASYDFFDIEEGTGVVKFFGSNHIDTSGTTYFLSKQTNFAGSINTQDTPVSGTFTKKLDLDFDITFNTPKRIKGDIILILTNTAKGGADANTTSYLIVKIKKNTTQIGSSVQTTTLTATDPASVNSQMNNIKINVPLTNFAVGDVLRITIEVWGAYSGSGGQQRVGIAHDPKERNDSALLLDIHSSVMEVQVPFLIDV